MSCFVAMIEIKTPIGQTLSTSMLVSAVYSLDDWNSIQFWSTAFVRRLYNQLRSGCTAASFPCKSCVDNIDTGPPACFWKLSSANFALMSIKTDDICDSIGMSTAISMAHYYLSIVTGDLAASCLFSPCYCATLEVPACTVSSYRPTAYADWNEGANCAPCQSFVYFYVSWDQWLSFRVRVSVLGIT